MDLVAKKRTQSGPQLEHLFHVLAGEMPGNRLEQKRCLWRLKTKSFLPTFADQKNPPNKRKKKNVTRASDEDTWCIFVVGKRFNRPFFNCSFVFTISHDGKSAFLKRGKKNGPLLSASARVRFWKRLRG